MNYNELEETMKGRIAKEQKRLEAKTRNEKWASLSHEEQLSHLDTMFGKDQGAAKQRAKIAKQIQLRDSKPAKKLKTKKATK